MLLCHNPPPKQSIAYLAVVQCRLDKAEKIKSYIMDRAFNEHHQSFVCCLEGESDMVDATLLLLPELGFIDASDPKFINTLKVGLLERFSNVCNGFHCHWLFVFCLHNVRIVFMGYSCCSESNLHFFAMGQWEVFLSHI